MKKTILLAFLAVGMMANAQMPIESTNVHFITKPAFCQTCVMRS